MRIPLFIEFGGRKVAVIGGGYVGTSRAKKFAEVGAQVTVFSLNFSEELLRMGEEGKVRLVKKEASELEEELKEFDLVVVAIGDKNLNEKFKELSRKYRFLLNLANSAEETEVVVPFEGGKGGIRFAVTTEGKSGVVARKVREMFQSVLENDKTIYVFLSAMEHLKKYMKEREIPVNVRMKIYSITGSSQELMRIAETGNLEEAKKFVEKIAEEKSAELKGVKNGF
ncbi:MAG: bifunctional precorrin-2 dehydrogenase/sirohydrochlorin ferrochelatase [Archaeoglobi archaeon]|jgi:precorrin-2 dehydrogenase/sirohydrochlorin ferrochelatase|nr:MAG: bifunctional precorrin-2 dehydrogenase/sirohydrochlorin ferrochelatase [Archaeoglobi archaeon]